MEDIYSFQTYFLTQLLRQDGPDELRFYTQRRNISLFNKKMIFFPFNGQDHWSLFVVINPGHIKSAYLWKKKIRDMPHLLYFDSLGGNSPHNQNEIARCIRCYLNRMWQMESPDEYDQSLPFSCHTFPLHRVTGKTMPTCISHQKSAFSYF